MGYILGAKRTSDEILPPSQGEETGERQTPSWAYPEGGTRQEVVRQTFLWRPEVPESLLFGVRTEGK